MPNQDKKKADCVPKAGEKPSSPVEGAAPTLLDRPMTPQQLARYLQISASTIARQVRSGDMPFMRIGGSIRFIPSDVIAHYRKKAHRK
jgi:excisionase family DNA binding protein